MNHRGYRCASSPTSLLHYANVMAAADDLALLSGCNILTSIRSVAGPGAPGRGDSGSHL